MRKTITLITIILTLTMTTLTAYADPFPNNIAVSYTHLTLPTIYSV